MPEEPDHKRPIKEVSDLLFLCLYDLQRTVMQDWQSLNMTMAQLKVVLTLKFKGPMAISKVAEKLSVSHPTASQLIDRLVQAGLVERVENITDRRSSLARLTEAGETLAHRLWNGRMDQLENCLMQLDEQDFAALRQGLRAFHEIAVRLLAEPPTGNEPEEEQTSDQC